MMGQMGQMGHWTEPHAPVNEGVADAFFNLLALVSNPEAVKARVKQIVDAQTEAQAFLEAAKAELLALEQARKEHPQALKKERAAHDRDLADAKEKFDRECAEESGKIRASRAETDRLLARARADAAAAAELKANLEARVAKMKAAIA
jgi:hypothetical protein